MAYNKKKELRNNIEAIRTALVLNNESRSANPEEIDILSRYSGFGGLKCVLDRRPQEEWVQSERELYPMVAELRSVINELSPENSEKIYNSIRSSVLTAFYTPDKITEGISNVINEYMGDIPNKMLEPSCGNGAFLKISDENTKVTAYEIDYLTGLILKYQNPDVDVRIEGFETLPENENSQYDIIASNIPFGKIKVFDHTYTKTGGIKKESTDNIHNYFFVKGLDSIREGGLLAFITSRGVADSESNRGIRKYLMENADLISAIRLTDDIFLETSGVEVGSDLIILQKNTNKMKDIALDEELFIESNTNNGITLNSYFNNPLEQHYLGKPYADTDQYGKKTVKFRSDEATYKTDFGNMLRRDFEKNFDKDFFIMNAEENIQEEETNDVPQKGRSKSIDGEDLISLSDLFGDFETISESQQINTRKAIKVDNVMYLLIENYAIY